MHTTSRYPFLKRAITVVLFIVAITFIVLIGATIIATGRQLQQNLKHVTQSVTEAGG